MSAPSKKSRWIASYERMLARKDVRKRDVFESEFSRWVRKELSKIDGYSNVRMGGFFQELERVLAVDVEFDYAGKKDRPFAAAQPKPEEWIVVQVKAR